MATAGRPHRATRIPGSVVETLTASGEVELPGAVAVSRVCHQRGVVDAAGERLRLRSSTTKRDRARWVQLPAWLVDAIEATCALEDRTADRLVFQGCTESSAYAAMSRACKLAKAPHYCPTTCATGGFPSGTSRACLRVKWRTALATLARQSPWTPTPT